MIKLHAKFRDSWDADPYVVRISEPPFVSTLPTSSTALLTDDIDEITGISARVHLSRTWHPTVIDPDRHVLLPETLHYLSDGDIVRIVPRVGEISVLYRLSSGFNSILVTERCNSNCLMCSQPPKHADDHFLLDAFLEAVPLMSPNTRELGITGGEPTLLGDRLLTLIAACESHLPNTSLHMLSNGRLFNYLSFARAVAAPNHHDLVIGVPLYSDTASDHDFVVQARGAFDQTVRGIMNLARCGLRVEIRIVLHRQTTDRLSELARFIARNLPFVSHVALMGLEMMGYVRMNLSQLWIDPADYQRELCNAVHILENARINVSIYNHQLCVLDQSLWPFARKSISDWKNEYLPICDASEVRSECGGFFFSSKIRYSDFIHAQRKPFEVEKCL